MRQGYCIFLVIAAIAGSCTSSQSRFPQGAWKLDQVLNVSGNKVVKYFPAGSPGSDIKMWTKGHFLFVGRFQNDTSFTDNYGGGKYTLNGNIYEEEIMYHSSRNYIGTRVRMVLELRHDTLVQTYPVNEIGEPNKQNFYIERYVRLE